MKNGNWIPVDKNIINLKEKSIPYTKIEAYISLRIDIDNNAIKGQREYARAWNWSQRKVQLFFQLIGYKLTKTKESKRSHLEVNQESPYPLIILDLKKRKSQLGVNQESIGNHLSVKKGGVEKVDVERFVTANPKSRDVVVCFLDTLEKESRYRPKSWSQKLEWLQCAQWAINQMGEYGSEKVIDIIEHFREPENTDNGRFNWAENFNSIKKLKTKNKEGVYYLDYFWEKIKEEVEYGKENG